MTETLGALVRYASDDPLHILPYLAGLGTTFRCMDHLLRIDDEDTEEEIHAFRIVEGCYSRPVNAPISVASRSE